MQLILLHGNRLAGALPQSFVGLTALESFYFLNNAGLCAPVDDAFQIWLRSIPHVLGSSCAPVDSAEDRAALVALYRATDGGSWRKNTNWLSDQPIREWHGVINNANGRVTKLFLFGNQLTGPIQVELSRLSNLERLNLGSNQLTGRYLPNWAASRT